MRVLITGFVSLIGGLFGTGLDSGVNTTNVRGGVTANFPAFYAFSSKLHHFFVIFTLILDLEGGGANSLNPQGITQGTSTRG